MWQRRPGESSEQHFAKACDGTDDASGQIVSRVRNMFRDDDDGDRSDMAELGIRTSTLRDNDWRRFTVQLGFCQTTFCSHRLVNTTAVFYT